MEIKQDNRGRSNAPTDPDKTRAVFIVLVAVVLLMVVYALAANRQKGTNEPNVVRDNPALQQAVPSTAPQPPNR